MPDNGPDELIPPGTAAAMLGVSIDSLARWVDDGRLAARRTLGGHRRYRRGDIEALMTTDTRA